MRHARILCFLALITFVSGGLTAAPRRTEQPTLRIVKIVKRFIAIVQSRITIPIGEEDPPPPPPDNP